MAFIRQSKLTGSHLKPYTKGSRWKGGRGIKEGGGRGERREKGKKREEKVKDKEEEGKEEEEDEERNQIFFITELYC